MIARTEPSPLVVLVAVGIGVTYVVAARRTAAWLASHPLRSRPAFLGGTGPATHELAELLAAEDPSDG